MDRPCRPLLQEPHLAFSSLHQFLSTSVAEPAVKLLASLAFWIIGRWLMDRVVGKIFGDTMQSFSAQQEEGNKLPNARRAP